MRKVIYSLFIFLIVQSVGFAQRVIHNVPESIITVLSSADGSIFALSKAGKLYKYDGSEFSVLLEGINGSADLVYQNDNHIVLSSSGIWKWDGSNFEQLVLHEDCYSYQSIGEKQFILTSSGMQLFREGRFQLVNEWTETVSPSARFYNLDNEYYLSNNNKIYKYKSGKWRIEARDTVDIKSLVLYKNNIWAASESGLRILKDRKLKKVLIENIDYNSNIEMLFALDKELYIQTEEGVIKWNQDDYQIKRIDDKSSNSNMAIDPWGDIWFADAGNIIQHKSGDSKHSMPILAEVNLIVDGNLKPIDNTVEVEEGSDIKINYNAYHLSQPNSIKFQSLLSPLDQEYQIETTDRSIVYSDILAGDYSYRLRATIDGVNYQYSAPIKLNVIATEKLSPFWWITGLVGISLLLLAMLANYRLQQYKERSELLTSKLRTANDLLNAQQKTMQLQMNPHFLFNALNSIQGLVSLNRNDEAKLYLKKFSRMMRSVLDFSSVDKIDLITEINYITPLFYFYRIASYYFYCR